MTNVCQPVKPLPSCVINCPQFLQIVVTDRRSSNHSDGNPSATTAPNSLLRIISPASSISRRNGGQAAQLPGGLPDVEISEMNQSHSSTTSSNFLNSSQGSLLLADAIKEARRQRGQPRPQMNPSLLLPLYYPKSNAADAMQSYPMAPLQPPWPLLPPLDHKLRKQSSASLPTSVRNFLEANRS